MAEKRRVVAKVLAQQQMNDDVYRMVLSAPELAAVIKPGQFLQLKTGRQIDPLLRRPISIADADASKGELQLVYRVLGEGTKYLAGLSAGAEVDLLGPLGNGFTLQGNRPLLVGGGMGIAPLLYLVKAFCPTPTDVLLAGRESKELFWTSLFAESCHAVHVTTDDGSMGRKGNALALLPELLASGEYDIVYTCGPDPMMKAVAAEAARHNLPCQVSLERYMACGIGACLSCSCAAKDGSRRKVCSDGPVFWAEEVEL